MSLSPVQRTTKLLRERSLRYEIVERHYGSGSKARSYDLFGLVDLLVLDVPNMKFWGIQVTDGSNHAKRVRKITEERCNEAYDWLLCFGRLSVWSWRYSTKNRKYILRTQDIEIGDLKFPETPLSSGSSSEPE